MEGFQFQLAQPLSFGGVNIPQGATLAFQDNRLFYNGQPLQLGLTTADVHDPTELATYLAGYSNEEFRWSEACPEVLVDKDEDKYRTYNSNTAFGLVAVKTTDTAYPNEVVAESSLTNYKVQPRRLAAFIPINVRQQAGANNDIEYVHMARCARAINMDLEYDVFGSGGLLVTSGNWNSNNVTALGSGYQWGGSSGVGASSDPIRDIDDAKEASAQRISDWWMNEHVGNLFLRHAKVKDFLVTQYGTDGYAQTVRAMAEASERTIDFRLAGKGMFHIVAAKYADSGSSGNLTYIMPNVMVGTTNVPGTPMNGEKIATCKNFRRRTGAGVGFNTRQLQLEHRGAGGTLVIVEEASIPTMTSTISGALITGCSA